MSTDRDCQRCGWHLPAECFLDDGDTVCQVCADPGNREDDAA